MTSFHKPAGRFHAETRPMRWVSSWTACGQKTVVCSRGLLSKSCACVERGARLMMVCVYLWMRNRSSATRHLPLGEERSTRSDVGPALGVFHDGSALRRSD